jgi:hypothetical protein
MRLTQSYHTRARPTATAGAANAGTDQASPGAGMTSPSTPSRPVRRTGGEPDGKLCGRHVAKVTRGKQALPLQPLSDIGLEVLANRAVHIEINWQTTGKINMAAGSEL